MATLVVENIVRAGVEPTYNVAADPDEFLNSGQILIHVKNGATDVTVTIVSQVTVDNLAVADLTVLVPANEDRMIGPFPTDWYNDSNGKVQLQYTNVVNVTIAVMKI